MPEPVATGFLKNIGAAVNVTAGEAALSHVVIINSAASTLAYLQIFDVPAANVTLGTTVPMLVIPVASAGGMVNIEFDHPIRFTTRLSVGGTTTPDGSVTVGSGLYAQFWVN